MPEAESLFSIASTAVVPAWLLLVFAPRWRHGAALVCGVVFPALLALLYLALIGGRWGGSDGGFSSLAAVSRLFADPYLLLAGWIHYLAFDLFIGAWEVRDAVRLGIPHLWVVPCLALTFLFGPLGLLLYVVVRGIRARRLGIEELAR